MARLARASALSSGGSGLVLLVLVGLPLFGLLGALLDPPADPFTGPRPLGEVFSQAGVWTLLARSLALSALVALGAATLGTTIAWAEARWDFPGRRVLGVAALLPLAVPSYVLAATVAQGLGPAGWLGGPLGLSRPSGFWAAVLVLTVVTTPLVQLVVGAALARQSAAEEEAARSLGASPARVFRVVVLPRLRPALGLSGLLALLYAISDFGAVAVLDTPVLTWRLYQAVQAQSLAKAAVLGFATLGATLPLFVLARIVRGAAREAGVANPRPPARRRPSPLAHLGIYGVFALVLGLGLALPVLTMGAWVAQGLARDLPFASPWLALGQTLGVALVSGAVLVLLAALPARTVARRGPGAGPIEEAVFFTSALPGVLLAFGLMLGALGLARATGSGREVYAALLGSGLLLLLGYAGRYLAETYAPLRTAFGRVDPRLRESARVLGATPGRWWRQVEGPLVAPGAAAALVLAVLAVLKELPVTLLLGGAMGLQTLAFRVWDRYREALWHDAGLAGLLLLALALGAVLSTLRWRRHA